MSRCGCEKETISQSEFSPGVVQNDEPIVYALVDPETFKDGSIKQLKHDRLKRGEMSVCRGMFLTGDEARSLTAGVLLSKDETRSDKGFTWAYCREIREIKLEQANVGAFCVVDDAFEHFPAHAHIGYSALDDKKNERQMARANLYRLLCQRIVSSKWEGSPPFRNISDVPDLYRTETMPNRLTLTIVIILALATIAGVCLRIGEAIGAW